MRIFCPIIALFVLSTLQPAAASEVIETKAFLNNSCVIADEPVVVEDLDANKGVFMAGLVSVVSQAVIGNVVSGVAGAIRSSGRGKNYVYATEKNMYLYRAEFSKSAEAELNQKLACVTLVSGIFENGDADCVSQYQPATIAMRDLETGAVEALRAKRSAKNILRRANICLAGDPHYFFEARMVLSHDKSAFRLEGAGFEIQRLQSSRREKDSRSVLVSYSIFEPSASGNGRLIANTWIPYGKQATGTEVAPENDDNISGWTRLPLLSGAARDAWLSDSAPYRRLGKEIQTLEKDILRAIREQAALRQHAELEDEPVAGFYRRSADKLDTTINRKTIQLRVAQDELGELPKIARDYMPVTVKVSVTEAKSEKAMQVWLANMIQVNSRLISRGVIQMLQDNEK